MFHKIIISTLLIVSGSVPALAQNARDADLPVDPAVVVEFADRLTRFQKQQLEDVRKMLGATDAEFKVMEPWLQKITEAQMDLRVSLSTASRGTSGGVNPDELRVMALVLSPTSLQTAFTELRQVLDDPKSSEQIISTKLRTVREERAKVRENLAAAQKGITRLLTARQEALLTLAGYLD